MTSSKGQYPTFSDIIRSSIAAANGPISVKELAEHMLELHPSASKKPYQAMVQKIREENGRLLVYLDADTVLPTRLAFQGVRFRLPLDHKIVNTGLINLQEILHSYLPRSWPRDNSFNKLRLIGDTGESISFKIVTKNEKVESLFGGQHTVSIEYANFSAWFRSLKVTPRDHLLFSIIDWENSLFRLEIETIRQRNNKLLGERNKLLADLFYDLLENETYDSLYAHVAVPTVYAHLPDKSGYPPYHWSIAVDMDGRMRTNGIDITYVDSRTSPLDRLLEGFSGEESPVRSKPITAEEGRKVYRFRAELDYLTKVWRTLELQGKSTLGDFDHELRHAFKHDTFDHLGGFWKLIPRGGKENILQLKHRPRKKASYREVDLGDVNPLGGGSAARTKIAGLEFAVGDKLKYVYDFGDWIEHILTLEAIEDPQPGVSYPREVGRNKPELRYCIECQKTGKQTVATMICLNCSTGPKDLMTLCENCEMKYHEDHYTVEIIY